MIGDYDADGKTDAAVLRITPSGSGTEPAYWYHRRSSDGVLVGEQWGVGDSIYPAPGDYEGDGKNDLAVQAFSGSNAIFFIKYLLAVRLGCRVLRHARRHRRPGGLRW